ncbi:hypothetical protein [Pelagicoccus sp. SDUM812005]|uniref:hypothetical protein n=1 Tax=Pelagicoccus sp. SDUM812005 TaxID=3041257 RepID=UPI00280DEF32|nr:hypothetical protein [Pelagicoccus sp. SDUM812005]MDQ8181116.1 hypothetical protein [Pelagicoccus sp. SDUM812005]
MKAFLNLSSGQKSPQRPRPTTPWNPKTTTTIPTPKAFAQRIKFILSKLDQENWLPRELKQNVRAGCARILEVQFSGKLSYTEARKLIENLASACYPYDELTLQSSTLCQIRTLDLEMNDRLPEYTVHSYAV